LKPPIVAAGASSRIMEIEKALSRLYRRAEALPRRFYHGPADQPGRARVWWRRAATRTPSRSDLEASHIKAQDRATASGKKLADPKKFNGGTSVRRLSAAEQQALDDAPPSLADNFRWRYYGLFYVAPAQDSYMCRLRIPNGILKHWQFAGLADLIRTISGPFSNVTTRPICFLCLCAEKSPPKHAKT